MAFVDNLLSRQPFNLDDSDRVVVSQNYHNEPLEVPP